MKVNNLIYISNIANFNLFRISRNIQSKPAVNIGDYSCISSDHHYITTYQRFAVSIRNKTFNCATSLGGNQTLFYRFICIERYTR